MNTNEKADAEIVELTTMHKETLAKISAIVQKTSTIQGNRKNECRETTTSTQTFEMAAKEMFLPSSRGIRIQGIWHTSADLELQAVRRENMRLLTRPYGAKSKLAQITGLSRCNISMRLTGKVIFDTDTAVMFCEALGVPANWLDVPRLRKDIPAKTVKLLIWEDRPHKESRNISKVQRMSPACTESTDTR